MQCFSMSTRQPRSDHAHCDWFASLETLRRYVLARDTGKKAA
jgi:hypothetical protein